MNTWPAQDTNSLNAFYGSPDNGSGQPSPDFEAQHLVSIAPPYSMVLAWDISKPVFHIRVNKKCADSLLRVLTRIGQEVTAADREKYQLNRYGGAYSFRLMRGLGRLSVHSWGAAIDLAPELNPLGAEYGSRPNMMPQQAVRLFQDEGWGWGGQWRRADAQHFQAAHV